MITADDIDFGDATPRVDIVTYAEALQRAILQEQVRREAKRRVDADENPPPPFPTIEPLRDQLARPHDPLRYRIEEWQPEATNVLLSAQFKTGKTGLRNNYTRSVLDGDSFLGAYRVRPIVNGTVAIIDLEMSETQGAAWFRDQGIRNDDRVLLLHLRGRARAFNIVDDRIRARWAAAFAERRVDTLIVDCLRPWCDALGLNEHTDGGVILSAFDALKAEAAIPNGVIVQHMGHTGERARGDSRFRDWPDVEWRIVRQDDNPASPRFITAYGRDVDVPESQLKYDPETRRLTILGGSRHDQKLTVVLDAIRDVLDSSSTGPMSGRAIKRALVESDHSKDTIDAALRHGVRTDALLAINGAHNSKLYSSVRVSGPYKGGRTLDTTIGGHWPDTAGHSDTHIEAEANAERL